MFGLWEGKLWCYLRVKTVSAITMKQNTAVRLAHVKQLSQDEASVSEIKNAVWLEYLCGRSAAGLFRATSFIEGEQRVEVFISWDRGIPSFASF